MKDWVFSIAIAAVIVLAVIGAAAFAGEIFADEDAEVIGTFYDTDYNVACWTYKTSIACVYIAPKDRIDNGEANVLLPR